MEHEIIAEVELHKLKFFLVQFIAKEFVSELVIDCDLRKALFKDLVEIRLTTRIWAEDIEDGDITIKYPWGWKEAFKERWMPKFMQRKWPVKYREHHIQLKAIYPKLMMIKPDEPCVIQCLDGGRAIGKVRLPKGDEK